MFTLHITNEVTDYDTWKAAFDKYERTRRDNGVLSYRIARGEPGGNRVYVDLDFSSRELAAAYAAVLEGIWRTPQSRAVLANHGAPEICDLVERQTLH